MDTFDLCIIGSGMFGSSAARHASANPCLKVCLIGPDEPKKEEYSSREIFSSYYDEGRIVTPARTDPADQILSKHTIERFKDLEKQSGIKFYHPVGTIMIAEKESSLLQRWLRALEISGIPLVDMSEEEILNKRFPFLKLEECFHSFLVENGGGHISARSLVEAQKRVAMMQGCHIITEVVEEVTENDSGEHIIVMESRKTINSKRILFCPGAFTNFKRLGLAQNLKIAVHKETAVLLEITEDEQKRLSSLPPIDIYKNDMDDMSPSITGAYILPSILYPDGKYYLKIGALGHPRNSEIATLQEAREWYSNPGDSELVEKLPKVILKIIPDLKITAVTSKTCLTCNSPTHLPYIDRLTPTTTVAAVGNGIGASVCDEIGRIAAVLSTTGHWDSEVPKSVFQAIYDRQ